MATTIETKASSEPQEAVLAPVLGSIRVSPPVREDLVHADGAPLHEVPKDTGLESALARAETLLGRGYYGAALREVGLLPPADPALDGRYEFIRHGKLARAYVGVANRYRQRGDQENARRFYERALQPDTADPALKKVADLAGQAFDALLAQRAELIRGIKDDIQNDRYAAWCGTKGKLTNLTILDLASVRGSIAADFRLEDSFGQRPPIRPVPGYVDPLPAETEFVAYSTAVPGGVFRAATDAPVDINGAAAGTPASKLGGLVRASLAFPVVANVMTAKLGLFALDQGLSVTGQADGVAPLFRYEHLRDNAKRLIAQIQHIESRMLPIQFNLDDFADIVDAVRRPLAAEQAELTALNTRIDGLTQDLAKLAQAAKALEPVVAAFDQAESQCDCDWFCWLCTVSAGLFMTALTLAVLASLAASGAGVVAIVASMELLVGATIGTTLDVITAFTCDNVGEIGRSMKAALAGVNAASTENEAELSHALASRDVLIARINALSDELSEVYQSNAARALDAKTLDAVQTQYNTLRQGLLTRAQAMARLAQDAFNFERDSEASLIQDAYYDPSRKGYSAAETLLYDLGGLDHVDLTGRTDKLLQLSHMVSLRKHSFLSFLAVVSSGTGRFTTTIADFDRWYPGTYLQRIKEVRVEVLVDGEIVPVRGYLSNDGVSLVRFSDPDNARPVDNGRVFDEPDADLARLCFKRLQRRRHADTMAFPAFESRLQDDRMRTLQHRERNFFENVGLESTWMIELLPDQPFDLSRVSDVRVWFQYEAAFDANLKRVLDAKRFAGRREMAALPIGRTLRNQGHAVDFGGALTLRTSTALFDAPAADKTIVNAGFALRLKDGQQPGGPVGIEVSFEGATPVTVTTTDKGVVATAPDHPAGTGLSELGAMVHGKSIEGSWTVKLATFPAGIGPGDVDELFLLLHCTYVA